MNPIREQRERLRAMREYLREERKKFGPQLRELTPDEWSPSIRGAEGRPLRAWRSREFLVQLFNDPSGLQRLSCTRTEIDSDGQFKDGITWDELMRLKREAGFGWQWAVECYPADSDIVNVANHRHLFLLAEPPHFGWGVRPERHVHVELLPGLEEAAQRRVRDG